MKGFLILADSVRGHPDGTFSLLRGGINRAAIAPDAEKRLIFKGSFLASMKAPADESGKHSFRLRVVGQDAEEIVEAVKGEFEIPTGGGSASIAMDFSLKLPTYGRFRFEMIVDDIELDTWDVFAQEPEGES